MSCERGTPADPTEQDGALVDLKSAYLMVKATLTGALTKVACLPRRAFGSTRKADYPSSFILVVLYRASKALLNKHVPPRLEVAGYSS